LVKKPLKKVVLGGIFGYHAPMRLLLKHSKFLILAVLSCSLLISVIDSNIGVTNMGSTNTDENAQVAPGDSIWNDIGRELNLDHRAQSSQVQAEIRKLLADQAKLYSILMAAGPYIYFIHQQTQARSLPAELALIPVIESEFNPNDHSKKGATGLWQLMPQTAHELGVTVKSGYDGRRNVIASTKAALAYFNDLGNNYKGDWYLAIAAYNCGQGRVDSVKKRTGTNNFWQLPLPHETKLYVPKLLAVAAIVKNPEKYGVTLPPITNKPYFAEVKVNKSVNLEKVAKSSGTSIETLHKLNPDYKHDVVSVNPKKDKDATLLVPINKAPNVKAALPTNTVTSIKV
jgi:membrane-bound lytic murein transglycosylase D